MKQYSIKKILILSFLAVSLISISFMLTQRYFWFQKYERESTEQDIVPMAESMGKIIEMFLDSRLTLLSQVSREIYQAGIDSKETQKIIESVHYRNPDIKSIFITNADGTSVAFSPLYDKEGRKNIGLNYADREYFKKIKGSRKPVVGEIVRGKVLEEIIIPLAAPILDEKNQLIGALIAGLDPKHVRNLIPYGEGSITLTDEFGRVIAMTKSPEFEEGMKDLSSLAIFKEANKQPKGIAEYVSLRDGRKKLGAFYNLNNGWKIWVSRDMDEMQQAVMDSFYYAAFWGAIALLTAGFIGIFLSSAISKPIASVNKRMGMLAAGDFSLPPEDMKKSFFIRELTELNSSAVKMGLELKHLYEGLEARVEERTIELESKKAEAEALKKLAEESSRAKSDFLANMSHELRTPLNTIIGFSEVLKDGIAGELNEKQKEYLNYISKSGRHLLSLINDILDLSKVEAGKLELNVSKFLLRDVLNGTIIMLKEKAMKHGITLSLEIAPEADIEIEADEIKLKQILYNLLSNAVKFTPAGGSVRVSARRVRSREPGDRLFPSNKRD